MARLPALLRAHGPAVLAELGTNLVLPVVVYDRLQGSLGDVRALIASALPPVAWSLAEFARRRRVDALSVIVLSGIALSLLALVGGGSARFLQLRENLVSAVVGAAFLVSAALRRPLIFYLAGASLKRMSAERHAAFEARRLYPAFRRAMMVMTLVWGFGLIASAALACALVFMMSIHDFLIVGPIVSYASMGVLALWTLLFARAARRRGEAAAAAAAAAVVETPAARDGSAPATAGLSGTT